MHRVKVHIVYAKVQLTRWHHARATALGSTLNTSTRSLTNEISPGRLNLGNSTLKSLDVNPSDWRTQTIRYKNIINGRNSCELPGCRFIEPRNLNHKSP
jgi:hypothetical protein